MSIPSCMRPHRIPNGLVTGPLTGQMRPAAEGVESGGEYEPLEPWIREARAALAAESRDDGAEPLRPQPLLVGELLGGLDLAGDPGVLHTQRVDVLGVGD